MTGIIKSIAILTILEAALSFLIPYQISVQGTWDGFVGTIDVLQVFAFFPYYGLIMSIAALVIGIATLKRRRWSRKANLVFQLVSIPIIVGSIVAAFIGAMEHDFVFVPFQNALLLINAIVILALLIKNKEQMDYRPITK